MLFDLAGSLVTSNPDNSRRAKLHAAGHYTLTLALAGALGAVISGLLFTHGKVWGRGTPARHHAFLWPGFGLLLAPGPGPQEMLLAAFNACLLAEYVGCSLAGIVLESLTIETEGELDLRGAFGLDAAVRPGYGQLHYRVHICGDGTPEQFQTIHATVLAASPNRWNIANAIALKAQLIWLNADQQCGQWP